MRERERSVWMVIFLFLAFSSPQKSRCRNQVASASMSDDTGFARSAADFDAALARISLLDAKTTAKRDPYLNHTGESYDGGLVDSYRFPKNRGSNFIMSLPISLRTNLWGVGWLAKLSEILGRLNLGPQDTLVQLGCGDGRWLVEAACMRRCNCIGYEDEDASDLEYRCGALASDREVDDLVEFVPCDNVLEADVGEATAVLCTAKQEGMAELREKLEADLDAFTPVVVVGGEVVGWIHQWSTKHRGVPMYLYERGGEEWREFGEGLCEERSAKALRLPPPF